MSYASGGGGGDCGTNPQVSMPWPCVAGLGVWSADGGEARVPAVFSRGSWVLCPCREKPAAVQVPSAYLSAVGRLGFQWSSAEVPHLAGLPPGFPTWLMN